ncbi:hypothetical protein NR798_24305 [Archangium gephyra]|uniref:hypothetical protein n=1 Tax=Archangium gephyra TaxID=48 RepID=UPI0035D41C4C
MALHLHELPRVIRAMFEEAIIQEICVLPSVSEVLCAPKPVILSAPIPFHVLDLEEFSYLITQTLHGEGLRWREPTGWRFLLMRKNAMPHTAVGYADVALDLESNSAQFLQVSCGQGAFWMAQAIEQAEGTSEVKAKDFDLSILEIPALSLDALWLQGHASGGSFLVPLRPAYHDLNAAQLYPAADLLKRLYEVAVNQPRMNNAPWDEPTDPLPASEQVYQI